MLMSVTHLGCAAEALQYICISLSARLCLSLAHSVMSVRSSRPLSRCTSPTIFHALNEATAGASVWNRSPHLVTISRLNEGYCLI